jgi:hypothetical protein
MSVSSYFGSKLLPTRDTLEGSSVDNEICLAECVLRLDGRLRSLGLRHDRVWGGTRTRLASTLGALRMPAIC